MKDIKPEKIAAPTAGLPNRRFAFGLLLASVTGLGMGQTVTFAILPSVGRQIGLTEFQVGSIFSMSAIMWILSSPIWGRLSDRWGRKPVILIGMTGYIVSTAALISALSLGVSGGAALLTVYFLMALTRSIYGMLGPGLRVASQAYIVDRTSLKDRTMAIAGLSAAFGVGNVIGPGLAAFSHYGLLVPLWIIVGIMVLLAIAVTVWLPETSAPGKRRVSPKLPWTDKRIRPFMIYAVLAMLAIATPVQTSAFFFIDVLGFEITEAAQYVGIGLTCSAMAALFSQLVLIQRFRITPATMMICGAAIVGVAQLSMAFCTNFGPFVFALMLNGLGGGMAMPGFNSGASFAVSRDEQGAVAGIIGGMGAAGFSMIPLINLNLYGVNPSLPYLFDAILMMALLAYCLRTKAIRQSGKFSSELPNDFEENFSN